MVKWGFSYSDLKNMPLDEFFEYTKLIEEHFKEEERRMKEGNGGEPQKQDPKPIGRTLPT